MYQLSLLTILSGIEEPWSMKANHGLFLLSQYLLVMKLGPSVCKACSLAMGSTVLTCCRAGMPAVHSVRIWGCCYTTVSLAPDNTPAVPVGLRSAPSVLVEQI